MANRTGLLLIGFMLALLPVRGVAADFSAPTRDEAIAALRRAVEFYRGKVAVHGSYVHRTSADLEFREGEQPTTPTQGWIESPGTAAVGLAYLEAHELVRDPRLLEAAVATGMALVRGQLLSGGWCEHIEFDPAKRSRFAYRVDAPHAATFTARRAAQQPGTDGFLPHDRPFDNEMNGREEPPAGVALDVTTFDDDKSQGSLRFLMRLDRELKFTNAAIHGAVQYALDAFLSAQRPNGGWPQHFQAVIIPPQPADLRASYPESWSREHAWTGFSRYYTLNDNTQRDLIRTMLLAHAIYHDPRCLEAARRGGDFFLLAQMPAPQPAWAQQYNFAMQPVWARRFEPPAISGSESQGVIRTLIALALTTGEVRYLEPIPRALDYLRASQLPDGRLARFYELRTNRPLFLTRNYELTYDGSDVPTHYGFYNRPQLDALARSHADAVQMLAAGRRPHGALESWERSDTGTISAEAAREAISSLDARGAWVEPGTIRIAPREPVPQPVIESRTFIRNLHTLAAYVAGAK